MLAVSEALRIGQRFGLETGTLLDIGEGLNAVGPFVGGLLRQQGPNPAIRQRARARPSP
jgi:hypothetical protein